MTSPGRLSIVLLVRSRVESRAPRKREAEEREPSLLEPLRLALRLLRFFEPFALCERCGDLDLGADPGSGDGLPVLLYFWASLARNGARRPSRGSARSRE